MQEVRPQDFKLVARRQARAEAPVFGVGELRVVDDADRLLALGQGHGDELREPVVFRRGRLVRVQLVYYARDVVHVRVRLDDLGDPRHQNF